MWMTSHESGGGNVRVCRSGPDSWFGVLVSLVYPFVES
jgi:hypothetical protein